MIEQKSMCECPNSLECDYMNFDINMRPRCHYKNEIAEMYAELTEEQKRYKLFHQPDSNIAKYIRVNDPKFAVCDERR